MKIILTRHGKPNLNQNIWLNSSESSQWEREYAAAGLMPSTEPSQDLIDLVAHVTCFVSSELPRSIESLQKLHQGSHIKSSLFNESDLPDLHIPWLRMKAIHWCVFKRALWLLGPQKECESYRQACLRAQKASNLLIEQAREQGAVLLVGHGIMNRLISRCLRKKGWRSVSHAGDRYWGFVVHSLDNLEK